jgi:hydrogenase nickel incorporation protein HypB
MKKNISVLTDITAANTLLANGLRETFSEHHLLVLNVISASGAGKTTLLEETIEALGDEMSLAVIEGDPYTTIDSDRIEAAGVEAVQINTMGGCHLEANMIQKAIQQLDLTAFDLVIIENVGNLVCPSGWDLGEECKVVIAPITDGDDKPLKYPMAFQSAQAMVISKIDLEPYTRSQASVMAANALQINPELEIMPVSAYTGAGMEAWLAWIRRQVAKHKLKDK